VEDDRRRFDFVGDREDGGNKSGGEERDIVMVDLYFRPCSELDQQDL
jgi:hypothetical protein